jgi:MFS family permease
LSIDVMISSAYVDGLNEWCPLSLAAGKCRFCGANGLHAGTPWIFRATIPHGRPSRLPSEVDMLGAKKIAAASLVGTALEYYDFAVYNSLAALVFGPIFFPSFDPLAGTILAMSTFAVGYLARPVGGILFGRLGDLRGRRFVLMTTLLVMGITTVSIGLLPTYAAAGLASPILLVVLRFVQGAALGGEWAGAVLLSLEHGAPNQRGRNASWAQAGPSCGTLLATGLIAVMTLAMSPDDFQAWGWRLPFLVSVVLVGFGIWLRRGVNETPAFMDLQMRSATSNAPVREVVRDHWRRLLIAGGSRVGADVLYSLLIVFTLTYLTAVLHQSRAFALAAVSVGGACNALCVPYFGGLSDRHGRRRVCGIGAALAVGWGFIYFRLLDTLSSPVILLAVTGGFLIHAIMYGPQAAFIAEQFPTRVRYAGSTLAYTLVGIVGGGLAPLMFATIMRAYGKTFGISAYLAAALLVTAAALALARETSGLPLAR